MTGYVDDVMEQLYDDLSIIEELKTKNVLLGSIIHSLSLEDLQIIENGMMIYSDVTGIIEKVINLKDIILDKNEYILSQFKMVYDYTGKLIIPGFIDAHCHAPQYIFTGSGMDLEVLDWLNKYTFPSEAKFSNTTFARYAYDKAIRRHLKNGTTFASYFGTIHNESGKYISINLAYCRRGCHIIDANI